MLRNAPQQCPRLLNSEILADLDTHLVHLTSKQREDVVRIIKDHPMLVGDTPTQTSVVKHDIDVRGDNPIRQH